MDTVATDPVRVSVDHLRPSQHTDIGTTFDGPTDRRIDLGLRIPDTIGSDDIDPDHASLGAECVENLAGGCFDGGRGGIIGARTHQHD